MMQLPLPSLAATAACRSRHGPPASCSAPMASWLRYLLTERPGCLPGHRDYLKRHDSLGFDAGLLLCPLVPRERSRGLARPPPAVSGCPFRPRSGIWRIRSIRPCRPSIERHGASVPTRVHLPPQFRHTRVSRHCASAPGRRQPRAMAAAPAPDFHRPAGLTSLSGWLPTTPPRGGSNMAATIAPAPKRHQRNLLITLAAAALKGRFSAPSLPDPRQAASPRGRVVTGRRLHSAHHPAAHTARPTNTTTPRIIVSSARVRPATSAPWSANGSTGWAGLAATAAGTTTSPPAPSPPRRDAWPRCRRTSSARPSCQ